MPAPTLTCAADRRVAEIAQVVRLAAGADVAVLDLDEIADVHAVREARAGPQARERADDAAARRRSSPRCRLLHAHLAVVADARSRGARSPAPTFTRSPSFTLPSRITLTSRTTSRPQLTVAAHVEAGRIDTVTPARISSAARLARCAASASASWSLSFTPEDLRGRALRRRLRPRNRRARRRTMQSVR